MKSLQQILLLTLLLIGGQLSAQEAPSKEKVKAARSTMKSVESALLKEKTDQKAVDLILDAKEKTNASYEYLTSLPGYTEAVMKNDKEALAAWKAKVKAEDETYIDLRKKASAAQKIKQDYLISISPEYKEALETYRAYRSRK